MRVGERDPGEFARHNSHLQKKLRPDRGEYSESYAGSLLVHAACAARKKSAALNRRTKDAILPDSSKLSK